MNYCARWLVVLFVGAALALPATGYSAPVRDIRVEGNQRIEAEAIRTYLAINVGDNPTPYDLDAGLKKLYETGFFADVSVDQSGDTIAVNVVENPSINEVLFEGNLQIDKEDLDKEITLRARSIYTRTKVQSDLKRLLDVYRRSGRYSAVITPQIIKLDQNRVNLVYNITEGPKALIEKVTFIGNEKFSSRVLEKIVSSSRERWYQFLTDSDKYDPDRLQYDQELLRKYYLENGYADFKVRSAIAELSPQRDAFYLTFSIEEGEQYRVGDVSVASKLPTGKFPELKDSIITKQGDIYNATEVESSINAMVDKLGDAGFAFVDINPTTKKREGAEKIIDLTYDIKEGPKVYVERININGNMRTLDEVIRREFKVAEGDAYSASKLKRTEQRLNNLGYFEKVTLDRKPGSAPDRTNLDVEIAEKSTGEISFGAGYSTADGPIGDFGIREKNFLGRGQDMRVRAQVGGKRQQYDLGFTEPYFLDRELEAGFDLFKTVRNYQDNSSFDSETMGGSLRTGYNLSEHLKHTIRYTFAKTKITNVDANASVYIRQQEGENTLSMIGHALIYDHRDNKFNPVNGYYLRFGQDMAGIGGDDRFLRHELQGEYYVPIEKDWTFMTAGSAGTIAGLDKDVRINQRFFTGGQEVRGFGNSGFGPRDTATSDALGANNFYAGTAELRFPLGLDDDLGVSGATFLDVGNAWGLDSTGAGIEDESAIRASAGFGLAWASPFGPIRIDIARPFLKQDYDETELIRFNFGTRF